MSEWVSEWVSEKKRIWLGRCLWGRRWWWKRRRKRQQVVHHRCAEGLRPRRGVKGHDALVLLRKTLPNRRNLLLLSNYWTVEFFFLYLCTINDNKEELARLEKLWDSFTSVGRDSRAMPRKNRLETPRIGRGFGVDRSPKIWKHCNTEESFRISRNLPKKKPKKTREFQTLSRGRKGGGGKGGDRRRGGGRRGGGEIPVLKNRQRIPEKEKRKLFFLFQRTENEVWGEEGEGGGLIEGRSRGQGVKATSGAWVAFNVIRLTCQLLLSCFLCSSASPSLRDVTVTMTSRPEVGGGGGRGAGGRRFSLMLISSRLIDVFFRLYFTIWLWRCVFIDEGAIPAPSSLPPLPPSLSRDVKQSLVWFVCFPVLKSNERQPATKLKAEWNGNFTRKERRTERDHN